MDVDENTTKAGAKSATADEGGVEDYSEVMNDPEFLQVFISFPIYFLEICSQNSLSIFAQ